MSRALALLSALVCLLAPPVRAQEPAEAPRAVPASVSDAGRGPRVVLVPAPGAPWAVVQLHVPTRRADPARRAALPAFAQALAFGASEYSRTPASAGVRDAGGEVRVRLSPEAVVVSDGVPADALLDALRAMDQRLRTRRRLLPAAAEVPPLPGPPPLPDEVRAALAPEQPFGQPLVAPGATPAPDALRALADELLLRDEAVLVVIGPDDEAGLARLVRRGLRTTLPVGDELARAPVTPAPGEHVLAEERARPPARGPYSWLWIAAPGAGFLSDAERRGLALAAHLAGGRAGFAAGLGWVSLHVPLTAPADAAAAEAKALARFAALAETLDDARLARARSELEGDGWRALQDPAALALALGRETRMRGQPVPLPALFEGATAADVRAAARALLAAPRVVLRHAPAPEGGS